jgi:hypothetical protein
MKYLITLLFLVIIGGCVTNGKQLGYDVQGPADVAEDLEYLCFIGCLEAEGTKEYCKKECYGEKKK